MSTPINSPAKLTTGFPVAPSPSPPKNITLGGPQLTASVSHPPSIIFCQIIPESISSSGLNSVPSSFVNITS